MYNFRHPVGSPQTPGTKRILREEFIPLTPAPKQQRLEEALAFIQEATLHEKWQADDGLYKADVSPSPSMMKAWMYTPLHFGDKQQFMEGLKPDMGAMEDHWITPQKYNAVADSITQWKQAPEAIQKETSVRSKPLHLALLYNDMYVLEQWFVPSFTRTNSCTSAEFHAIALVAAGFATVQDIENLSSRKTAQDVWRRNLGSWKVNMYEWVSMFLVLKANKLMATYGFSPRDFLIKPDLVARFDALYKIAGACCMCTKHAPASPCVCLHCHDLLSCCA